MQSNDMRCVYLYAYIRVIGKTNPIHYMKKIDFDVKDLWRVIFFSISFFYERYQLEYSQNLLRSKYDLIMMAFNSWTDTRQISAAPNSHLYLILLFGK